ncbi:MAG: hypothetical protein V2J55_10925 [Candidatus Competibacteraceae bacterium]|jgi:hypothetical protein|nr:hypothetical protein [Candidatus Competibacteraceae bacterium]
MTEGKKKKFGIYAAPPLLRLIEERANDQRSPTRLVNIVADRYLGIVRHSVPVLSVAEWSETLVALRQYLTTEDVPNLATLWDDVEDTLWNAKIADEQTGDVSQLANKLRQLRFSETVALVDVAERFWQRYSATSDITEALEALGVEVCHDKDSTT